LNNLIENIVRESAADISCRLREIKTEKKTAFDNKKKEKKRQTTKKNKTLCKHI
jgi:hypothetical protein